MPWTGKQISLKEFLPKARTNAFLVLRDGKVTYEWYGDGFTADTRMPSWSVAKSVVSLLVGQAIERGKLHESDRLVDLLPELRSKGTYDSITVRDLLDMSSRIDVDENYSPWRPFTGTAPMMLTGDLRTFVKYHRDLTYTPGNRASYRSVDTMMLGLILMRVEKKTPADLVGQSIWKPMGATHTATWNLDRPQEMGHSPGHARSPPDRQLGPLRPVVAPLRWQRQGLLGHRHLRPGRLRGPRRPNRHRQNEQLRNPTGRTGDLRRPALHHPAPR